MNTNPSPRRRRKREWPESDDDEVADEQWEPSREVAIPEPLTEIRAVYGADLACEPLLGPQGFEIPKNAQIHSITPVTRYRYLIETSDRDINASWDLANAGRDVGPIRPRQRVAFQDVLIVYGVPRNSTLAKLISERESARGELYKLSRELDDVQALFEVCLLQAKDLYAERVPALEQRVQDLEQQLATYAAADLDAVTGATPGDDAAADDDDDDDDSSGGSQGRLR